MKFKYVGQAGFKDLDLTIAGIFEPSDVLIPDTVFEIPDDNVALIKKVKLNGNYQVVKDKPKFLKKMKKKEEKEEEDKGEDK